ncbi:MAG: 4-hydroxy-3-methylbut-2-enyl diphosphate reductase [Candidatus Tectomicrobia bacterium]|nr:4-hydroxy-3-methylbut-2-enyl diphosphate reductase [Candidatus Tectomicrobia bacterium]
MAFQELVLAKPRGFCAGVVRAIEVVERALDLYGPPIYVRKEIVHNKHVVEDLKRKGAIFVEELEEVPEGAITIFSAHGVAPAVVEEARRRRLKALDATCPLVTKVHGEVRRYVREGYHIILVGHMDHDEVIGTYGEAPEHITVISRAEEVEGLTVPDPQKVVCLTQTTLSVDDASEVVAALKKKFSALTLPSKEDICYATQNRQTAVKQMTGKVDLLLVLGSRNSSNSMRLKEVAESAGIRAYLIDAVSDLDPAWFEGVGSVGVTAGASTPEFLVREIVEHLKARGIRNVREAAGPNENVVFHLPAELVAGEVSRISQRRDG